MDLQSKNVIEIISAYVNNRTAHICDPDWDKIIKISSIHNLKGLLYLAAKDMNLQDDVINRLKRGFFSAVKYSAIQSAVADEFFALLNKNEIKHIVFKGFVLKDYYPVEEIRTMGDIDVVIKDADRDKVHDIMIENGFLYDDAASHQYVKNYIKNGTCFEVHTRMVSKNIYDDVDLSKYFKNCFDYALLKDGCKYTYELNKEYHFIYLIVHMAMHFKFGGCGLRMILDIVFMLKKFGSELDMGYIKNELQSINLDDFLSRILALSKIWFYSEIEADSFDGVDAVGEYIIDGGVFGQSNKSADAIRAGNKGRVNMIWNMIFPSYDHLKERYVWFGNTPKYMLPFAWLKYWRYRIKQGGKEDFTRILSALKNNKDASCHDDIMNMIGLK